MKKENKVEDIIKVLPLEKRVFLKLRQRYNICRGGRRYFKNLKKRGGGR